MLLAASDAIAGGALTIALLFSAVQIAAPLFVSAMQLASVGSTLTQLSRIFAIAGVAVRAWRDGLQLAEDREQYQEALQRLRTLRDHWIVAANDEERWRVSMLVEQAAVEELRSFLPSHERAQFLF